MLSLNQSMHLLDMMKNIHYATERNTVIRNFLYVLTQFYVDLGQILKTFCNLELPFISGNTLNKKEKKELSKREAMDQTIQLYPSLLCNLNCDRMPSMETKNNEGV